MMMICIGLLEKGPPISLDGGLGHQNGVFLEKTSLVTVL